MSQLKHVLGLKRARRDLLLALKAAAESYCEDQPEGYFDYEDAKKLRSSAVFFIAEFLFVLRELDLTRKPEDLEAYLLNHNADLKAKISKLQEEKLPATPSGLTRTRLEEGLITPEKIDEIIADARAGFFRFDQSTLGALLTELMVKQSTNSHVATLGKLGFLNINGRKPKFISSTGKLEDLYAQYLKQVQALFNPQGA